MNVPTLASTIQEAFSPWDEPARFRQVRPQPQRVYKKIQITWQNYLLSATDPIIQQWINICSTGLRSSYNIAILYCATQPILKR